MPYVKDFIRVHAGSVSNDMTPYSFVISHRRFGGACNVHLQSSLLQGSNWLPVARYDVPEASDLRRNVRLHLVLALVASVHVLGCPFVWDVWTQRCGVIFKGRNVQEDLEKQSPRKATALPSLKHCCSVLLV